uniref:FERM domain-containing protein n=1 Tax=Panagrolaimus sp. ES5 TaxID=591445 RepID=A0AC34GNM2_9BILA
MNRRVVNVVLHGLGLDQFSTPHFALRLAPAASVPGTKIQECHWLHPGLRMPQVARKYLRRSNPMPLRFELKIRFIPKDIREMYQTEMSAFLYFYDQLAGDYINHVAWKIETDFAIEMGALMLKKRFPNITVSNVEKKLDFHVIENEGGLLKYFPESFVLNVKKKQLQKNIVAAVKRIANFSELECVFRFLNQLMKIVKFDAEIFRVSLGLGWHSPIELHISEKAGVSYKTENSTALIQLAKLRSVVDICIRKLDNSDKAIVRLRISAQSNPLVS